MHFFLLKWFPVIYLFWTLNPNEAELKLIQFSIPIIYFGVRIISELRAFDYIYYYFLFFALVEFKFLGIVGIIGFVFLSLIWGAVLFVCRDFDFDFFFFFIFFLGQNSWIPLTLCMCGHLWIKMDYFIWLLEKNSCWILLSFFFLGEFSNVWIWYRPMSINSRVL